MFSKVVILFIVLFTQNIFAKTWEISIDKDKEMVSYEKGSLKFSYSKTNVNPKVREVIDVGGFQVVIFLAESAGTFVMLKIWNGAVFDKDNKLVGIYPREYEAISGSDRFKPSQPSWEIQDKKLIIIEPEYDERFELDLP